MNQAWNPKNEIDSTFTLYFFCSSFAVAGLPPPPRAHCDMEISDLRSPRLQQLQQPKTLMVTSSSITGESFHTFTDPDQYPDLLNIHPKTTRTTSPPSAAMQLGPQGKVGQPLNPAALVVPPTPPAQFPHQFPHLIHNNKQQVSRAHSPTNQSVLVSPLLSPPAQFSSEF